MKAYQRSLLTISQQKHQQHTLMAVIVAISTRVQDDEHLAMNDCNFTCIGQHQSTKSSSFELMTSSDTIGTRKLAHMHGGSVWHKAVDVLALYWYWRA